MKILILSCSTGGGHNSCAKYISEELKSKNIDYEFKDYFDIVNKKAKSLASKIYLNSLGKDGKIFKKVYKMGELYSSTKIKSPIYLISKAHRKKLYKYIKNNSFDLVITTHLFPGLALTAIKNDKKEDNINFIMVATDYEPCPFIEEVKPNFLVIPKGLEKRCLNKGINENILLSTGIPVSTNFIKSAKNIRKKLKINDENVILVMLGSMGFGRINEIISDITNIDDTKIIVVCGSNTLLYRELSNLNNSKIIVLGFVNNINDLIYSSDIVLSKPGGLSTTEIISITKPLIHIFPIPGIETYNSNFFSTKGMSLKCNSKEEIITSIKRILSDKNLKNNMIKNQKEYINKNSAKDLVEFIVNNFW